jgi:hypothetical protein
MSLRERRVCDKLGVAAIATRSPQAKGRVERKHGAEQGQPVKELRLAGISTTTGTNRFLEKTHLPKMNQKFSLTRRQSRKTRTSRWAASI